MNEQRQRLRASPPRLALLDAVRGVAALSVVLFHWQHFWVGAAPAFNETMQPFYTVLWPLYRQGWRAVDLFFCLSGFIFFWLYADRIGAGAISAGRFAVLRLSRLYPLHLATLLVAAVAQLAVYNNTAAYFAYDANDAYHFVLQALFVSGWGFERAASFNAPAWSVSVEMLLYITFFVVAAAGVRRSWQLALCAAFGLTGLCAPNVGRGLLSFYMGGLTCLLFLRVRPHASLWRPLLVCTAALWIVVPIAAQRGLLYASVHHLVVIGGRDIFGGAALRLSPHLPELILFPLTTLTIALVDHARQGTANRLALALGNMSYSSYLLHFPLQIVFFGVAMQLGLSRDIFYSPSMLFAFMSVLIALSLASHRYFEVPMQTYLRGARPRAARAPQPAGETV